MFNRKKLISGIAAVGIYFLLILIVLYNYNIHDKKAKNYVEKNSNRVTVTLVNSNKTVLNKKSKVSNNTKPKIATPLLAPIPKKQIPHKRPVEIKEPIKIKKNSIIKERTRQAQIKKNKEVKERAKQAQIKKNKEVKERAKQARIKKNKEAKERAKQAQIKKNKEAKERAKQAQIKKNKEAKERAKQAQIKKNKEAKERAKQAQIKKNKEAKERAKQARIKKNKEAKERARQAQIKKNKEAKERDRRKNLFASVNTKSPTKHKEPAPHSRIKHNSSAADRIKNTHQSGQTSDRNREKGVQDAYKAKVQRQLNNWNAQSSYKGHTAVIKLTISSSGHFRYTITRSSSASMSTGLKSFLKQLNRMGLGRHTRSRPYVFSVTFKAR